MGMESIVYGFIQGPHWPHEIPYTSDAFSQHPEKQRMYMDIE